MSKVAVVAIDGPSGVGKGTLSQFLTCKSGFHLLDSGAIYRALAFGAIHNQIDLENHAALVELALRLPVSFMEGSVIYEGKDVTSKIRTEETAAVASKVAAIPEVRTALLDRQKAFSQAPGLIADGRDMGTIVFPDASLKLFLTASAEVRALRRVKQLKKQGIDANIEKITQDIRERDERDANRKTAPLVAAEDAITIDTSNMNIEQVCQSALTLMRERGLLS
ncbi:(d)CMP kinase [Thiomicrorhabdus heinhorstiae]|uniref:Cytidylate kinase n=1 Tax=Thiomicrorhabdus heinhorstiae TaxID=2748010 RepID=A0ABS0BSS6_9GAMM|nr:(d)CMP kinase [Thiomicrorhabdus heinhorstiae]MBF6056906.1 (d)CMP kinase [Thiomicrorhabdus heinhorstiae]